MAETKLEDLGPGDKVVCGKRLDGCPFIRTIERVTATHIFLIGSAAIYDRRTGLRVLPEKACSLRPATDEDLAAVARDENLRFIRDITESRSKMQSLSDESVEELAAMLRKVLGNSSQ